MTNWRWVMCAMLFFATTVNYMDRQVLSLTWKEFIQPEFHWSNAQYGDITGYFSIAYAIFCLFAFNVLCAHSMILTRVSNTFASTLSASLALSTRLFI